MKNKMEEIKLEDFRKDRVSEKDLMILLKSFENLLIFTDEIKISKIGLDGIKANAEVIEKEIKKAKKEIKSICSRELMTLDKNTGEMKLVSSTKDIIMGLIRPLSYINQLESLKEEIEEE